MCSTAHPNTCGDGLLYHNTHLLIRGESTKSPVSSDEAIFYTRFTSQKPAWQKVKMDVLVVNFIVNF